MPFKCWNVGNVVSLCWEYISQNIIQLKLASLIPTCGGHSHIEMSHSKLVTKSPQEKNHFDCLKVL